MTSAVYPIQLESINDFLKIAERLDRGDIEETDLATAVTRLPSLTETCLVALASHSQTQALNSPRFGWAIARVADETAVVQQIETSLQARAAWYLGRAANNYFRPNLAFAALARAKEAFQQLKDEDWVAACIWQQHALPWAKTNLHESAVQVQATLDRLSVPNAALAEFREHCRLTLAYIQALMGNYSDSKKRLRESAEVFKEQQDQDGLINCQLICGNVLIRQSKFEEAILELEACVALAASKANARISKRLVYFYSAALFLNFSVRLVVFRKQKRHI